MKHTPRQTEVASRPQLCPGGCRGGVGALGRRQVSWERGREGLRCHGGGCSPVLLRIHPHQLQIQGVDIVALEEDGAWVSSRAQTRCSPALLAQPCPQGPATGTPLVSPSCSVQHAQCGVPHHLSLFPISKAVPPAPFPPKVLAGNLGSASPGALILLHHGHQNAFWKHSLDPISPCWKPL